MSYKIIRVLNGVVSIASNDGTFFNVSIEELDFDPKVGDEVQCFRNGEKVIVLKKDSFPRSEKTASKIETNGFERKNPIANTFVEDIVEKKSRMPWIIGIILLLLGVVFVCIYFNSDVVTMTDPRDGKKYKTVVIGTQTWMAENLDYDMLYSWNIVSEKTGRHYGRAYPWKVALHACPEGWHLPSVKEFQELLEFLGGKNVPKKGKKLLSRRFGGTNATGFDAQRVGYYPFSMNGPRNYSFDQCYRSNRCKNFKPEGVLEDEYIEGLAAVFWSSDLDDYCAYDHCGPLPKLGSKLYIDSSGDAYIWGGSFSDGYDWWGVPVRCLKN